MTYATHCGLDNYLFIYLFIYTEYKPRYVHKMHLEHPGKPPASFHRNRPSEKFRFRVRESLPKLENLRARRSPFDSIPIARTRLSIYANCVNLFPGTRARSRVRTPSDADRLPRLDRDRPFSFFAAYVARAAFLSVCLFLFFLFLFTSETAYPPLR